MRKALRYIQLLPYRINQYGWKATVNKIIIDISLKLDIPVNQQLRWNAAHTFHTSWKLQQQKQYGTEEYNNRIDQKSLEVLNDFYETGTDFMHKTVVDVGCGTRGVLPVIKAATKIGVDPTINKVKNHFTFPPDIIYLSEKAEEISLTDESVDIVICNNALNHFENDKLALAQMHRILKPGGLFLLEVFIEPLNIAHTYKYNECILMQMITSYFKPMRVKHEQLKVKVEIDEKTDGSLPMRWGGVFKK